MLTGTSAFSLLLPRATMEFIPRHICPAVLFAQAFCSSKNGRGRDKVREGKESVSDGRKIERDGERDDGQSQTARHS